MPVFKRQYKSGKVVWSYVFSGPGATREDQRQVTESGFATKKAAQDAEAARRSEEKQRYELERSGAVVVATELPKTLGALLEEFFAAHCEKRLAPKTVERYRECAVYVSEDLRKMPIAEITPLHLNREWSRLLEAGGKKRGGGSRAMAPKTVRNIAGVVSAAYGRAVRWGLVTFNPVTASEPPVAAKRRGVALTVTQQDLLIAAASGPWCMGMFLEMEAALGARRGEVLALRWSDIEDGRAVIGRSLCQTRAGLVFKATKTDEIRVIGLPAAVLGKLEAHRARQAEYREQYRGTYREDLNLIFANPDGTPLRPNSVSATVSALFKRLKIAKPKGAALHLLRHSHGSHLLAQGVPLPAVSARLGHSSVRVTADVYAHAIHGQDDEAVKKWEEYQARERSVGGDSREGKIQ